MRHIRDLRFCACGARELCARHGWDWSDFLVHGIQCDVLEASGDGFAIKLAQHARSHP